MSTSASARVWSETGVEIAHWLLLQKRISGARITPAKLAPSWKAPSDVAPSPKYAIAQALSYRAAPHATADDPKAYIDLERVEEERARECLGRYEGYVKRAGVLTDEAAEQIRAEAADVMRAGIAAAEAEPPADIGLVFEHAYGNPPPGLADDLAELRRILGGSSG